MIIITTIAMGDLIIAAIILLLFLLLLLVELILPMILISIYIYMKKYHILYIDFDNKFCNRNLSELSLLYLSLNIFISILNILYFYSKYLSYRNHY